MQVLKSGKYKFVKNLKTKAKPRKNPSNKRNSKRRSNPTPNKKRNNHKKGNHLIQTSFRLIRTGALLAPFARRAMQQTATPMRKVELMMKDYTGYDYTTDQWRFEYLKRGWAPYVTAVVMTHGVPKLTSFIKSLF